MSFNDSRNGFTVGNHGFPPAAAGQNGAGSWPGGTTVGTTTVQVEGTVLRSQKFHPKAIGAMQIVMGFINLVVGSVLINSTRQVSVYSGVFFWGTAIYVSAGILSIAMGNTKNSFLVNASVGINILSAITAIAVMILLILDFTGAYTYDPCTNIWYYFQCSAAKSQIKTIKGVVMVFSMPQVTSSIAIAVYGCKASCFTPPVVSVSVVQNQPSCPPLPSQLYAPSNQQDFSHFTNSNAVMDNLPSDDPPSYSECVSDAYSNYVH